MDHEPLDALDLAIMRLPLEEAPPGLRSSILMATAFRPVPAFAAWELVTLGAVTALAVWLIAMIVLGGASLFAHTVSAIASTAIGVLANSATAAWLAAGAATAVWLTLFTGFQPASNLSHRSERRSSR